MHFRQSSEYVELSQYIYMCMFLGKCVYCVIVPVGVSTDVVDEWAVFEHSLHFAQRHIFTSLQLHQVLLSIYTRINVTTI